MHHYAIALLVVLDELSAVERNFRNDHLQVGKVDEADSS